MRRRPMGIRKSGCLAAVLGLCLGLAANAFANGEVNIYSYRQPFLIKPMLNAFTHQTGIKTNVVFAPKGMIARLKQEGKNSPADVILTVDIGRINDAVEAGVLQPVKTKKLTANVPSADRDPAGLWYGLTRRARIVYASRERVKPGDLSTYEALADPIWSDRVLVRSSSNIYNQSLIASMIEARGTAATEEWARGLVANMARDPKGGDTDQIRAVAAGEGDVAIVNTYYYGGLAASADPADRAVAGATRPFFPNQGGRGTHVNISGAGVCAHAPNAAEAIALLEYLVGETAQAAFAALNHEIPVRAGAPSSDIVAGWGAFEMDDLPLAALGERNREAIELADRAGWR